MRFASEAAAPHWIWLTVLAAFLATAGMLAFIFVRRVLRKRWFRIRDRRDHFIRHNWTGIVNREIPATEWLFDRMDRRIVEEIALDRMDVAGPEDTLRLQSFFRDSGLLDRAKHEARRGRGWRRRHALLTVGRMRVHEALPTLTEALDNSSEDVTLAAVRALGQLGVVEAGVAIVKRLARPMAYPKEVVEWALSNCFKGDPTQLAAGVADAADGLRPLLSRVLAEVAAPDMPGDLIGLASDPIGEVRAAAARILAVARRPFAATVLCHLAGDKEWFVRLRAVVALGILADPFTIPVLIRSLCDRNRLVRLRAAAALAAMDGEERNILHLTMLTGDKYALQALVSELERSGKIARMVDSLADEAAAALVEPALLTVVRGGSVRLLGGLAIRHPDPAVRGRLAGIVARSHQLLKSGEAHEDREPIRAFALVAATEAPEGPAP